MNKIKIFILVILITITTFSTIKSQYNQSLDFTCGMGGLSMPNVTLSGQFEGVYKPNRTDTINSTPLTPNAFFPVLIVFVQFSDDASYSVWPNVDSISGPIYRDSLIALSKNSTSEWWNAYDQNTQVISDFYIQLSRGRFHVLGKAYSVVLDHDSTYYQSAGEQVMNFDIWKKLNHCYNIDWPYFDKWGYDFDNEVFTYAPDGNIDFIYKIHKTASGVFPGYYGFGALAWYNCSDFQVDTVNHKWIKHNGGYLCSGITSAKSILKDVILGTVTHEHGHYISSAGHLTYGKNSYGVGFDAFYSPYEMIFNRYMYPRDANLGQTNSLDDYSSRNNENGEIIKVSISETECFLLANRRKVSHWDRVMLGDTAFYNVFNDWDYGKGLYIYHVFNGIYSPTGVYSVPQDMESADGYYRWDSVGLQSVYMNCWTSAPTWPVLKKAEVLYTNDPSTLGSYNFNGDELSLHHYLWYNNPDGSPAGMTVKFSWGKLAVDNCHLGTDRNFTNSEEIYTSYTAQGTRYDAWNVGYNEVFSPYSSPSTMNINNDTTGIFIWYNNLSGTTANIKIEKASEHGGNKPLSQILQETPPSRPMGLTLSYTECIDDVVHPILTWKHNMEPDMIDQIKHPGVKRYRIGRAISDIDSVPRNYGGCADQYFSDTSNPTFIDYATSINCIGNDNILRIRYIVKAVDKDQWESVPSDFVATSADNVAFPDNIKLRNNVPKDFKISQNYPNPFNPVTNIKYELPKDVFVTIKIYDILGREIKTLVNEYKNAGRYLISFNGSELASGIYFYRIVAGNFISVKRMVLIK